MGRKFSWKLYYECYEYEGNELAKRCFKTDESKSYYMGTEQTNHSITKINIQVQTKQEQDENKKVISMETSK